MKKVRDTKSPDSVLKRLGQNVCQARVYKMRRFSLS
jgi:hypothetical protein